MNLALKKIIKRIIPKKISSRIVKIYIFLDFITVKHEIKKHFFFIHGYKLNLRNSKSFNEKIIWKKLFDRNPLIPITTDKYKVRKYIEDKLGNDKAKEYIIPAIYVSDNPEKIPFESLTDEYILKPNHSVNRYIIAERYGGDKKFIINDAREKYTLPYNSDSIIKIINICNKWLNTVYGVGKYEWAYSKIKPLIIIEKLLKERCKIPKDYK